MDCETLLDLIRISLYYFKFDLSIYVITLSNVNSKKYKKILSKNYYIKRQFYNGNYRVVVQKKTEKVFSYKQTAFRRKSRNVHVTNQILQDKQGTQQKVCTQLIPSLLPMEESFIYNLFSHIPVSKLYRK